MFQTKLVEKITKHFLFNNFFLKNYEITWKNMVEADRPQMTIWRMHFACWITKSTNTHSE